MLVLFRYRSFFQEVKVLLKSIDKWVLLFILLLSTIYFLIQSYECYLICKIHNSDFCFKDNVQITYISAFFKLLTLGSAGMVAGVYCYHKKGLVLGDATGVWLVQYWFYRLTVLLMGMFSFLCYPQMVRNLPINAWIVGLGIFVAIVLIVLLTLVAINQKMTDFVYNKFSKLKISNIRLRGKVESAFAQIKILQKETKRIILNKKLFFYILGMSIIMMILYNMIPSIILSENVDVSIWYGINVMSLTNLLAGSIPLPSGFGSVEMIYYSLLLPFDIKANSIGAIIMLRFGTVILPFIVGGLSWFCFCKKNEIMYMIDKKKNSLD